MDNASKIILGTVQFGLKYGINNHSDKPTQNEVFDILNFACDSNIDSLDTADAYGDSIEQIGNFHKANKFRFKILSKFKEINSNALHEKIDNSLRTLNVDRFEVYSYHSFRNYIDYPNLKNELITLKNQGLINKVGISVYSNKELEQVTNDGFIDVIQLPYNILDNDNLRGSYLELAKMNKKEIHIRSVFLQGLFFMDLNLLPEKLLPLKPYLQLIHSYCNHNSVSIKSLALNYALHNKNIDYVLIGVDNKNQLAENLIPSFAINDAFEFINQNIRIKEIELLNPTNWR